MKQKLIELFGIDKQSKTSADKAIAAYDKLLTETGDPNESLQMRVFIHALGGHKLNEETQTELIERSCMIVELERHDMPIPASLFKWDSNTETPRGLNEVKKSDYKWKKSPMSGDPILLEDVKSEKINKSNYKWGPDSNSMGSGIQGGIV